MKLFGSLQELLSLVFRKNSQSITVRPNQSTTYTAARDIQLPPGDTDHVVVSATSQATFTNKTFDADGTGNSITNIENADIKAGAAIDATKIAAGTVDNTEFGYLNGVGSSILGKDDSGTFTQKTISGSSNTLTNIGNSSLSSGIDAAKIGAGTVSNTEFGYLDGVGSALLGKDDIGALTNKTISGANNTISNVAITSLSTVLGDANKALVRDGSGAVTSALITNSNVDAAAAIAGTKVSPSFGSQNISTTGTASAASANVTGTAGAGFVEFDHQSAAASTPAGSGDVRLYAKSDKLYTKNSLGVESEVGAGGGGINYIDNDDFEGNATTGWATYADAAGTSPVDGTGGSPSITLTVSASSPLRGTYSGLITKDAANRQGQGVSYDFTIAAADKSKPLSIRWEGEASANYTGSSGSEYMTVFVYDVTNATVLPVSGGSVAPGSKTHSAFFVSTTSTSYRLIFHVAGTGTSSWTYKLDSVSVGPQSIVTGAAMTDWQSFTPTWGNFSGSLNASSFAIWRRVGDSMEIQFDARISSFTSMGALNLTIPGGYSANSTYKGDGTATDYGHVTYYDDSANVLWNGKITMNGSTSTQLDLYAVTGTAGSAVSSTFPFTWANADRWSGFVRIPISQWSSNVTLADRAVEEFSFNTNTANSSDTTSFGYGPQGVQFGSYTGGAVQKTVQFTTPILATDKIFLEVSADSGARWVPIGESAFGIAPYTVQAPTDYGMYISNIGSQSAVVQFGTYRYPTGTSFAAAGASWAGIAGGAIRWRVRKVSGGAAVGYPVSSANVVGRLPTTSSGDLPASGYIGQIISDLSTSAPSFTASTYTQIRTITLTAGVWRVFGQVMAGNGGTAGYVASIISTSNSGAEGFDNTDTSGGAVGQGFNQIIAPSTTSALFGAQAERIYSVAAGSTTTLYLVGYCSCSSGSWSGRSKLIAVRIA